MIGLLDLLAIPTGTRAFRVALLHMTLNIAIVIAYAVNFIWRHSSYPHPAAVRPGPLVLSVVSLALLTVSGSLGGMLSYRYGVRVAREADQTDAFRS